MDQYNPKSCNALEKPFYRPAEAALRWCGLIDHEVEILAALHGGADVPRIGQFPQWPCLKNNTEKILDAISNGDIPYGRDGKTVTNNEQVRPDRRTVRHTDLREWMAKHYPDQKPAFLFDETERQTHAAFNADSFRALQADLEATRVKLAKANESVASKTREMEGMLGELTSLRAMVDQANTPSDRAETTYLNIIGALMALMLGETPAGKPQSVFKNQVAIINALLVHHADKPGISERTLQEKFAAAKRSLAQ